MEKYKTAFVGFNSMIVRLKEGFRGLYEAAGIDVSIL